MLEVTRRNLFRSLLALPFMRRMVGKPRPTTATEAGMRYQQAVASLAYMPVSRLFSVEIDCRSVPPNRQAMVKSFCELLRRFDDQVFKIIKPTDGITIREAMTPDGRPKNAIIIQFRKECTESEAIRLNQMVASWGTGLPYIEIGCRCRECSDLRSNAAAYGWKYESDA
jgi:hypothetical protein